MAVTKDELYRMIDALNPAQQNFIYGVVQAVSVGTEGQQYWNAISKLDSDSEPFNAEELRQFNAPDEYITLEPAKKSMDGK